MSEITWDEPLKYLFMNVYQSFYCSEMYHNVPQTMIEIFAEFSKFKPKYIEKKFKQFEKDYLFDDDFVNDQLFIPSDEIVEKLEKCYFKYKSNKNLMNIIKREIPQVKNLKSKYLKSIILKKPELNNKTYKPTEIKNSKPKLIKTIKPIPTFQIENNKIILNCGIEILFKTLLQGVEKYCDCHSDKDIFKALSEKFKWCIYIIQNKEYNLLQPIEYVGYTKDLYNRLKDHERNLIYDKYKHKIRINVHLSEYSCIEIFKPLKNDKLSHSFKDFRIFQNENYIEFNHLDNSEAERYLLKYDIYEDVEYNTLFCYDSRYKQCAHVPNCKVMKYYNIANNLDENNHIEESFRKDIKKPIKINFVQVDDVKNIGQVLKYRQTLQNINVYISLYNTMFNKNLIQYLNNPTMIISKILEEYSLQYLQKIIYMITKYIECLKIDEKIQIFGNDYIKICYKYSKILYMICNYTTLKNSGKTSNREKQNWMSVGELELILNKLYDNYLETKERDDYQKYIIFLLYMKQNTMRGDYYNIKYKNFNSCLDNFIDLKKCLLVFNNPLKVKKELVYKLKPNVVLHLEKFILFKNESDYLFTFKEKEFSTSSSFNRYIQTFLSKELKKQGNNKSIGVQMLRKIITTDSYSQEISVEEEINLAHYMNHSVSRSKHYYNKN